MVFNRIDIYFEDAVLRRSRKQEKQERSSAHFMKKSNNYVTELMAVYKEAAIEEQSSTEQIGAVFSCLFLKRSANKGDRQEVLIY